MKKSSSLIMKAIFVISNIIGLYLTIKTNGLTAGAWAFTSITILNIITVGTAVNTGIFVDFGKVDDVIKKFKDSLRYEIITTSVLILSGFVTIYASISSGRHIGITVLMVCVTILFIASLVYNVYRYRHPEKIITILR